MGSRHSMRLSYCRGRKENPTLSRLSVKLGSECDLSLLIRSGVGGWKLEVVFVFSAFSVWRPVTVSLDFLQQHCELSASIVLGDKGFDTDFFASMHLAAVGRLCSWHCWGWLPKLWITDEDLEPILTVCVFLEVCPSSRSLFFFFFEGALVYLDVL